MSHDPQHPDEQLRDPQSVRGPDGTRADGRPTHQGDVTEAPVPEGGAPTEAPEERGEGRPTTEHAPGGDL